MFLSLHLAIFLQHATGLEELICKLSLVQGSASSVRKTYHVNVEIYYWYSDQMYLRGYL